MGDIGSLLDGFGTALHPAAPAPASASKQVAKTEEVAENVAEILKDGRIEAYTTACRACDACMAEAVIHRALLAIGQDGISLAAFFEFLFGIRIVRIPIRMKLQGELAIGALNLLLAGATSNPEHLVVITFSVAGQNRPFPNPFRVPV